MVESPSIVAWPAAKISPPVVRTGAPSRALVSRPRLLAPLNTAVKAGRVILVVAPGGSGKTSLLADWARQAPLPVAWYALDAADRDARRLVDGLCAAVERTLPGGTRPARAALDNGASEAAVMGLLLGALEGRPITLVLDDFQHLDERPEAMALWDHLLRFRPPTLALIILSRSVPLLGFAALAALDELVGLGRADLKFDADEAADLLTAHGLDTHLSAQLAARSGGWATGVLLLARAAPDGVRFLRARVDALMEHLGAEMLMALSEPLRDFMLESAALGPSSPQDADTILGRRDSAAFYAEIAARDLFLDHDEGLYRYHDLFAEYLVGVLKAENPDRLRAIRRAGAEWWCAHGDLPRALGLLAAGEDWEALAAMLDHEHAALWARGLWGTAVEHVEHLPSQHRTPRLLALCGHARSQRGEHAEALALADAGMVAAKNDEEWLSPALLRAQALIQARRFEEGARSAEAAITVGQRIGHTVAVMRLRELRGIAWLRLGRFEEGHADLLAALSAREAAGDEAGEALSLFYLGTHLIDAGHARDAGDYLERAGALWQRLGNRPLLGDVHNSRALLHTLTGDLVAARTEAARAVALARELGHPILECAATATLAEVCSDAGEVTLAGQHAQGAMELAARLDLADVLNDALRVRIAAALLRRDRAGARRLIDEARPLVLTPIDGALLDLYDGHLALRARAFGRAAEVLGQAAARLEAVNRPQSAARAHLLHAEALLASGSVRRAEDALNRMAELVLSLGCEGYLRPLARLARQALARRRVLRRLRRDTRTVLEGLAAAGPSLPSLTPAGDDEPAPDTLWLSPFGHGHMTLAGRELDVTALPVKARELLFFAAHVGRPLHREVLMETIWEADAHAPQALWDASRHIRRLLGEESWGPRGGLYGLHVTVHDDGREFDRAAAAALGDGAMTQRLSAAEHALALAGTGGYLEWCDSLWASAERTRVGDQIAAVALAAAQLYEQLGRPQDAIAACRKAVAADPFDEAPRKALLRQLVACGEAGAAVSEYQDYQSLLREELAAEPSSELRTLAVTLGCAR